MSSFSNPDALWDLSLPPSLPALADDDFITLLQKQFGVNNLPDPKSQPNVTPNANIDPQALTRFTLPGGTPPLSDESSPSPPSITDNQPSHSRRQSSIYADSSGQRHHDDDPALKRKASDEDMDNEPTHKSQHTTSSAMKKSLSGASNRRKSGGNTGGVQKDESRLLKRKEQNRAAQRAFRERKEKHVKDLEDQVAALEEKNQSALTENETLREVIARLQNENVRLRGSSFTFSVPSGPAATQAQAGPSSAVDSPSSKDSPNSGYPSAATSASSPATAESANTSPPSLFLNEKTDSAALFGGPEVVQQTATTDAMGMDFGFGPVFTETPYTTIASNPLFMSFREPTSFSTSMDTSGNADIGNSPYNAASPSMFDWNSPSFGAGWPDVTMQDNPMAFDLTNSLDELFGGQQITGIDMSPFGGKSGSTTSLSPVVHHRPSPHSTPSMASISSASSSLLPQPSPISQHIQPQAQLMPQSEGSTGAPIDPEIPCPKSSKCTVAADMIKEGSSAFSPPLEEGGLTKDCESKLPMTEKNEKNVDVMKAWRQITTDPKYRGVDVNELCFEFATKARCDGTKVVIEPDSMQHILETVNKQVQN
ncbi:hypothetical protein BD410DRAFT_84105 [Rickenella mellea]|uniref:BZIP domain-containing protein n=1 Tax=Rickenella mellea TaxID=50990 RepID=A0A4Y7PKC8_9AGAM|nr:hypothetical protein BD410DRAFT_84105 [Rickenella mellea]